jgi:hypothetical protein
MVGVGVVRMTVTMGASASAVRLGATTTEWIVDPKRTCRWWWRNRSEHVVMRCGMDSSRIMLVRTTRAKIVIWALLALVAKAADMFTAPVAPNVGV